MIDPITSLGASTVAGAVLGMVSNFVKSFFDNQVALAKIGIEERKQDNEAVLKYQAAIDNSHPPYRFHIMLITATYCLAVAICFVFGDVPVATFSLEGSPTETTILFFKRVSADKDVYMVSLAAVGFYLLSPLAFILTSVFTGIVPKRGR
jgi:hypothetical protein